MPGFGIISDKKEDYIHFKVLGKFPGKMVLQEPDLILHSCKEYKCNKVLLDITELEFSARVGDIVDFRDYINRLNKEKDVKLAVLRHPKRLDVLLKVFERKRVNYFKTFTDKDESLSWLLK